MSLFLVKDVCQMAFAAILSVGHGSHEDTSSAGVGGAFTSETLDLSLSINLVELEYS